VVDGVAGGRPAAVVVADREVVVDAGVVVEVVDGSCAAGVPWPVGGVAGAVEVVAVAGEPYTGPPLPPSVVTVVGAVDGATACAFGSVACWGAAPAGPATVAASTNAPNVVAASVAKSRRMGSLGRAGRWGRVVAGMAILVALAACSDDAGPGAADDPQGSPVTGAATERPTSGGTGARPTSSAGGEASSATSGSGATGAAAACPAGPSREITAAGGPLAFADATDALGLTAPLTGMMGHAAAVADVDGDGWVDLFVGTFADRPAAEYAVRGATGPSPDRLLLGGPDGFHVDDTFPGTTGRTTAAAFADLDGDGDPDLAIARNFRRGDVGSAPSLVFRNDGGRLVEAGELATDTMSARAVVPIDLDGDGHLDLVVLADRFGSSETSRIFKGDGRLGFTDATAAFALPADVVGLGAAAADLTGDGWPDLVVVGEAGRNRLFVNDGKGKLREDTGADLDWPTYGKEDDTSGVAVADLDRDGRLDVVIGHHYTSTLDFGQRVPVRVYRNERTGTDGMPVLQDVTDQTGIPGFATKAPQVDIADFDDDGWPDILVGASAGGGTAPGVLRHVGVEGGVPRFEPVAGFGDPQYWVTGATFDADHDGRLDVFMVEFDATKPSPFWRGTGPAGHWLDVTGAPIGSVVEVYEAGGLGQPDRRLGARPVVANTGYGSGSLTDTWFGLGGATTADVRIVRPFGAEPVDLPGLAADRAVTATGAPSCPAATARPA
jgi:hypothetical protein